MENKQNIYNSHIAQLKEQLQSFGLPRKLHSLIDYYDRMKVSSFTIPYWIPDHLSLTLIELNYKPDYAGKPNLDSINFSYRCPLEKTGFKSENNIKTGEGNKRSDDGNDTLDQITKLYINSLEGQEIAKELMYKHWMYGYYQRAAPELPQIIGQYGETQLVKIEKHKAVSIPDLIRQLKSELKKESISDTPAKRQSRKSRQSL